MIQKIIKTLSNIPHDKLLHQFYGAVGAKTLSLCEVDILWALSIMTMAFFAKELYDRRSGKGTPEWKDIIAGYVGFIIGYNF